MTKRPVFWVAAIAAVAAVLAALAAIAGVRFYSVMTPSMGTTAPVGTLVITRPAPTYNVGDIVTYERNGRSYTHRIITANADGTFVTKGDLNGAADPLPVTKAQVVGRTVWIAPGLGWLWQGLPWLILGFLLVYAASFLRRLDHTWQWIVRISGWTLVFCLVAIWLRPWVSLTQLSWVPSVTTGVDMHVVNTGLFPLDVLGSRLTSGQDAIVHVTEQNANGYYVLTPALAFYWWEQVGLFLLCLVPFALSFLIKDNREFSPTRALPVTEPEGEEITADTGTIDEMLEGADTEDADTQTVDPQMASTAEGDAVRKRRRRHLILTSVVILAIIISASAIGIAATTSAALTAKVTNSANTAATRTFFTCNNAVTSTGSTANPATPYLAWAMGTKTVTSETDLTGNKRTGTYKNPTAIGTSTVGTTTAGCNNDNPKTSVYFDGSQCLYTSTSITSPTTFSLEAWFWAKATPNGKIIGIGNTQAGTDSTYDRHIYLDDSGRVVFGTYNNGYQIISSSTGYADGAWHNVIATFSASTGMILYIDGAQVAKNTSYTVAESTSGYWKVGCGNLANWPNGANASWSPLSGFKGQIQFAAVYSTVLNAAQVKEHYQAGLN